MNVIISQKQKERLISTIKEIVEDIKVPLSINVAVEIVADGTIYVLIPLKGYLAYNSKEKYESLIRNKIKDYIGLGVEVILMEKSVNNS